MESSARRVRLVFRKVEAARYLSHLDLMATLEYAVRRAGLPVERSEGFTPRPRIAVAAPLALGYLGEAELLDLTLRSPMPAAQVAEQLQRALPSGIEIVAATELPDGARNAASRLRGAVYRIELPASVPDLAARISALLDHRALQIEEVRENHVRRRDVRPLIHDLQALGPATLRLHVIFDDAGGLRPEQVLDLLGLAREATTVVRERLELAGQT